MSASIGGNDARQAALLIDADNFSEPQAIEAAWAEFQAYAGRISVCRAYGAGPRLEWLRSVWRYLGTRTFPNLALEKNTTDAALIADAVALHFQQGVRIFAIASGDADFAPLAVRLREWGCEVWCFSMEGIVFRDAETYYDRVTCFPAPVLAHAPAAAPVSIRPAVPAMPIRPAVAPAAVPIPMPVLVPAPAPQAALPEIPVRPLEPLAAPGAESISCLSPPVPGPFWRLPVPEEVQRILKAVPGLNEGPQQLSRVVCLLRQQGILAKTTKSTSFLARYSAYFELSPAHQPTVIGLRKSPDSAPPAPAVQPHDDRSPAVRPAPCTTDAQALGRILAAFPNWQPDTVRQLSLMDTLLQEGGIQFGAQPLDALFGAFPDYFKLLPDTGTALKVRLLRKPEGFAPAC